MSKSSLRLVVLGAAAGLVAAWAMEESQKAIAEAAKSAGVEPPSGDPATVKAADRLSMEFSGQPIAPHKREQAGRIVHYATGAALGAVYTYLAERAPFITWGFGGLFGLAVTGLLDEGAAPALGFSPPASEVPLERHGEGVAAHLIFGSALEAARQVVRVLA